MYVDVSSVHRNGKTYTRYLLRESYREGGQIKHRTLANLSHCAPEEIEAIRLALRHSAGRARHPGELNGAAPGARRGSRLGCL